MSSQKRNYRQDNRSRSLVSRQTNHHLKLCLPPPLLSVSMFTSFHSMFLLHAACIIIVFRYSFKGWSRNIEDSFA